jgi:hypothetical protein
VFLLDDGQEGAVTAPQLNAYPISCGGGVRLQGISWDTSYSLSRTVLSTGQVDALYSTTTHVPGELVTYIDTGEIYTSVNLNYLPEQPYSYTLADSYGTVTTSGVVPQNILEAYQDELDIIFIRLMKAALDALSARTPFPKPRVLHEMPLIGLPPLPLITINQDLLQQSYIPIGQDVQKEDPQMLAMVKRIYTVTVYAENAPTRNFYRTNIVAIFEALCRDPLTYLGQNVSHRFQVASSQINKEKDDKEPGFYYANCMLEFEGVFNIQIVTPTTIFQQIDFSVLDTDGDVISGGVITSGGFN